ncbi:MULTISPECIES: hypothetical protein [unclassified Nitratiruptor]|uniref:hypothetical protein n=1 Tax=unclassified Nitratiruptor TaxID=2624044 RepID=UPI001915527A|nr:MULTISPECIES: hypothetical protein [unclassified Nitratiruptor]BCD59624.1 phage tail protein [Nitratiruptor sp. YY08-10]BCD63548.1 phage tail protein [Nitratiruptor sp. YY08-14]BCD83100.1 phage tail protein [Nitratiruptor phage NrS-2]BCD83166.1 phage tail protein [Nitratiruptor phage NrS-3]
MRVEIQGLSELQTLFKKLDKDSKCDLITTLLNKTHDLAKKNMAKHHKTGKMEHNLYKKKSGCDTAVVGISDEGMMVDWKGKSINYALFVHFGSQPHFIHPRFKKALRWSKDSNVYHSDYRAKDRVQEKTIFAFAKAVRHPGYKGDPFLYDALDEASSDVNQIFGRFVDGL